MKIQTVSLDLKHGLGHLLVTKLHEGSSLPPENLKRGVLAALQLLQAHDWLVPTKAEIVALRDDLPPR